MARSFFFQTRSSGIPANSDDFIIDMAEEICTIALNEMNPAWETLEDAKERLACLRAARAKKNDSIVDAARYGVLERPGRFSRSMLHLAMGGEGHPFEPDFETQIRFAKQHAADALTEVRTGFRTGYLAQLVAETEKVSEIRGVAVQVKREYAGLSEEAQKHVKNYFDFFVFLG